MAALMRFSSFAGRSSLRMILDRISHVPIRWTSPLRAVQSGLGLVHDSTNVVARHYAVAVAATSNTTTSASTSPTTLNSTTLNSDGPTRPARWTNQRSGTIERGVNQRQGAGTGRWANQREATLEPKTVEGELRQLDDQVRRWGRVDKEQVRTLLKLVAKEGSLSTQHGVILLRSTGTLLVKETPAERAAIFEDAWKQLQSIGVPINVQMMNTVLKVKLENGQSFSPAEVLVEMENKRSLEPNRITYQFLVAQFCETGDIEGASKILEHMKSQNMSINESVFNTLIKGHMRKGDLAGAKEVLKSMRDAGLEPSSETYKTLMCALAEKGDVANVQQALADAEKEDLVLNPSHLFDVIASFVVNGHAQHIDLIIGYIKSRTESRYNQDAMNCMFQLIANGFDEAAYKVFLCMSRGHYDEKDTDTLGRVVVRTMVIKGRAVEKVMEMSQRLIADGFFTDQSIDDIAFWSFTYQSPEYILRVLDNMKSQGRIIHSHYYYPVIKAAAKAGDLNGVLAIIPRLLAVTDKADKDSIIESVYPMAVKDLVKKGVKTDVLLSGLKGAGLRDRDVEAIRIALLASEGRFGEASKLLKEGSHSSLELLRTETLDGFTRSEFNVTALFEFLESVNHLVPGGGAVDLNTVVLVGCLNKKTCVPKDTLDSLVSSWIEKDLKVCKSYETLIRKELSALSLSEAHTLKLDGLFVNTGGSEASLEELKAATVAQLEEWTARAKRVRSPKLKTLEKWLLGKYCDKKMVVKADALKAQLDGEGFIHTDYMLNRFAVMAARDKGNLDEALEYLKQIETKYPTFDRYLNTVLHIANLQLKSGKFDDALKTITDYTALHAANLKRPGSGLEDGYMFAELCQNLVRSCGEHVKEPGRAIQLTEELFNLGYIKSGTYSVLEALIDVNIQRSNDDGILSALEHCVTKYSKTPLNDTIFRYFIAKEDVDRLQTAVDLVSSIYGEQNVLLHLLACFIECGKLKQARKIMETPGLKASTTPLIICCDRFIRLDKEKELEQLVDVTKGLVNIDRDEMFLQLMRLQAKRKDAKKLLEVFSLFEEEGLTPRNRTLRYVAKVLQSLNEPVPFDIPEALTKTNLNSENLTTRRNPRQRQGLTIEDEADAADSSSARKRMSERTTKPSKVESNEEFTVSPTTQIPRILVQSSKIRDSNQAKKKQKESSPISNVVVVVEELTSQDVEARKAVEEKDFDRIMKIKDEVVAAGGVTRGLELLTNLVQHMQSKRLDAEIRKLFFELSKIGDVESLVALKKVKLSRGIDISLHRSILQANLHRNEGAELLKELKVNLDDVPKYIGTATISLLAAKQPDLFPTLIALITDFTTSRGSKSLSPVMGLFNYYVLGGDSDRARTLLNDFPTLKDKIPLSYIVRTAKIQKREDILHELLSLFKEGHPSRRILAYNQLLQLKCEQGDWAQALDSYNLALGDGLSFDSFWLRSLQDLQTVLEATKQPVPWTADMLEKKAAVEHTRTVPNRRKGGAAADSSDSSDSSDDEKKKPAKL